MITQKCIHSGLGSSVEEPLVWVMSYRLEFNLRLQGMWASRGGCPVETRSFAHSRWGDHSRTNVRCGTLKCELLRAFCFNLLTVMVSLGLCFGDVLALLKIARVLLLKAWLQLC